MKIEAFSQRVTCLKNNREHSLGSTETAVEILDPYQWFFQKTLAVARYMSAKIMILACSKKIACLAKLNTTMIIKWTITGPQLL